MREQARFGIDEARAAAIAEGEAGRQAYAVPLERGTLELGYYAPNDPDTQQPHDQDELYFVTRGHGVFWRDGEEIGFGVGDALFVAAGVEHRFIDFSDDLELWVVFWGPSGGEAPAESESSVATVSSRERTSSLPP